MIRLYAMQESQLPEEIQTGEGSSLPIPGAEDLVVQLAPKHWQRIDECIREEDKRRRLMGCLLTARALYECRQTGEAKIYLPEFAVTAEGKPFLEEYEDFYFNISHSGSYAVCAASDAPIGIDIQQKRPISAKLAKRFFSAAEQAVLAEAGEEKKTLFFRIFTAKEAYIKYTGMGMKQGMQTFTADLAKQCIVTEKEKEAAHLAEIELPSADSYCISLCSRKADQVRISTQDGTGMRLRA